LLLCCSFLVTASSFAATFAVTLVGSLLIFYMILHFLVLGIVVIVILNIAGLKCKIVFYLRRPNLLNVFHLNLLELFLCLWLIDILSFMPLLHDQGFILFGKFIISHFFIVKYLQNNKSVQNYLNDTT
jgi:hypothetical protein